MLIDLIYFFVFNWLLLQSKVHLHDLHDLYIFQNINLTTFSSNQVFFYFILNSEITFLFVFQKSFNDLRQVDLITG